MTDMIDNSLTAFFCGGTGIAVGLPFYNDNEPLEGMAPLKPCYVDASRNIMEIAPHIASDPNAMYFIKDKNNEILEGGGSDRTLVYEAALRQAPAIIQKFKPTKYVVVVHGGGGASGSTIGPILANQLVRDGHIVFLLVCSSECEQKQVTNSVNVLTGYNNFAVENKKNHVMFHWTLTNDKKSPNSSRGHINSQMHTVIRQLQAFIKPTIQFDTNDIRNWSQPELVIHPQRELLIAHMQSETITVSENERALSVLTITTDDVSSSSGAVVPWVKDRTTSESVFTRLGISPPLHMFLVTGENGAIHRRLSKKRDELLAQSEASKNVTTGIVSDVKTNDGGLIL